MITVYICTELQHTSGINQQCKWFENSERQNGFPHINGPCGSGGAWDEMAWGDGPGLVPLLAFRSSNLDTAKAASWCGCPRLCVRVTFFGNRQTSLIEPT